ncbi:MAG TPA: ornithine cyclodeaminase family protein [Kofleriaceae bacterium]|nr:ornithine cyclodeaminase family protein [Kofleriaceae bacterium]
MLFLSRADVARLLDIDALIDAIAAGFIELSAGKTVVPPRVAAASPAGLLLAMPGYASHRLATKLVSYFPGNAERELPSHHALVAMFDAQTGAPTAVIDGTLITAMRTAAASAVAVRALARPDSRVLVVLGAGVQARAHLQAVPRVRSFDEIVIANRSRDAAKTLADEFEATVADSFEAAVRRADVLCLCTNAPSPVIDRRWLRPGTHVSSVGWVRQGAGEVDADTVHGARIVVESRVAFSPPPAGAPELQGLDPTAAVELGEVLAGMHPGRTSDDELTLYKSMGHAVEDIVTAALVYDRAVRAGVGIELPL